MAVSIGTGGDTGLNATVARAAFFNQKLVKRVIVGVDKRGGGNIRG